MRVDAAIEVASTMFAGACNGAGPATLGGEWPLLRQLCVEGAPSDNDVPDAWLAAAAIHQGEHVVSFDADFRRLMPREQFTLLSV